MTNINRQEVTDYLTMYNVPAFLIDLIGEDELGTELVKGWHNAQLEYRYKVLAAIERFDLYADGKRIERRKPYRAICFYEGVKPNPLALPVGVPVVARARAR